MISSENKNNNEDSEEGHNSNKNPMNSSLEVFQDCINKMCRRNITFYLDEQPFTREEQSEI